MRFDIDLGTPPRASRRRDAGQPLRVLVIGNFSGNAAVKTGPSPFSARRLDLDSFDHVMAAVNPRLELGISGLGESRVHLAFRSLDDFHPDAIFRECGIFTALREKRALLSNPATFAGTAADMLAAGKATQPLSGAEGAMFERLLGSSGRQPEAPAPSQASVIQNLINRVVAPHIVHDIAPEQSRYIASVDAAIAALMKNILHAPEFQALEAAWRGARALLDETEGAEEVQLWLADAGLPELADDFARSADATNNAAFELIVGSAERAADAEPWSIVIGNYLFRAAESDLEVLSALGALCRRAGALFIAGADSNLAGCNSFGSRAPPASWDAGAEAAARWRALRVRPFSRSIALAAPRVLARLPYGKAFEPIESFAFEEFDDAEPHESFLWGNAAFTLGRLLIHGFVARGWEMQPGDELELDGLPAVVRGRGDDRTLQACAETHLGERGGEKLLSLGLVPVLSYEQRAAIRLMRVQSVAEPAASLAQAW